MRAVAVKRRKHNRAKRKLGAENGQGKLKRGLDSATIADFCDKRHSNWHCWAGLMWIGMGIGIGSGQLELLGGGIVGPVVLPFTAVDNGDGTVTFQNIPSFIITAVNNGNSTVTFGSLPNG